MLKRFVYDLFNLVILDLKRIITNEKNIYSNNHSDGTMGIFTFNLHIVYTLNFAFQSPITRNHINNDEHHFNKTKINKSGYYYTSVAKVFIKQSKAPL